MKCYNEPPKGKEEIKMKTIETKIAKNGAQLWYVDGKRVSRETAQYHERENERYQEWLEKVAMERLNAAIDDYAVTVEAQDAAVEAEQATATRDEVAELSDTIEAATALADKTQTEINALEEKAASLREERDQLVDYLENSDDRQKCDELRRTLGILISLAMLTPDKDKAIEEQRKPLAQKLIAAETKISELNAELSDTQEKISELQAVNSEANKTAYNAYQKKYAATIAAQAAQAAESIFNDYAVTVEAGEVVTEAEIEQATEYAPVKFIVGKKYRMAPYKVDTITIVKRTAKTVEFVIDDDDDEAQVIRRKISSDCGVESISYGNSNTLDNFWVEAKDIVDEIEQSAGTEEDTETKAERIAALERGIERIINERQDAQDELEDAEADAIATAIENLPDDMQAEVAAAIEPFKAEYAAALEDIYVDDQTANGEIIPAADMLQFVAPFALTDHSLTAYRKNDDGTFTEDKAAFARLLKVENKIFNVNEPAPEKPDTPPETQSPVVEHMNRNAPAGWSIKLDKDKIRVEYQGKHVADTERLTKRDQLVPQAFFDQFIPLVDKSKTPAKMFLEHRYRELEDLETMQQSPDCPPDTRRKLDEMIEQLKRDIAEAEFGDRDTVESFCKAGAIDENGDAWF